MQKLVLHYVEVLEATLTAITSNDGLEQESCLVAHSKLSIDEKLGEHHVQDVFPQEGIKVILLPFSFRLDHGKDAIDRSKAVLPSLRMKHLLKECNHDELALGLPTSRLF